MGTGNGSLATSLLVVLLVLPRCSLFILWITLVPVLPTMPSPRRVEELASSTVWSMSTRRLLPLTVSLVSTVDLSHRLSVSLFTVVFTLVFMTRSVCISVSICYLAIDDLLQNLSFLSVLSRVLSLLHSVLGGVLPSVLALLHIPWTLSGMCYVPAVYVILTSPPVVA